MIWWRKRKRASTEEICKKIERGVEESKMADQILLRDLLKKKLLEEYREVYSLNEKGEKVQVGLKKVGTETITPIDKVEEIRWELGKDLMEGYIPELKDDKTPPEERERVEALRYLRYEEAMKRLLNKKEYSEDTEEGRLLRRVYTSRKRTIEAMKKRISDEVLTRKYVESPSMLEDTLAIPQEVMDIIGDYGKTLDTLAEEKSGRLLHPLSKLPHSKRKIESALKTALGIAENEAMRKHLETVLLALEDFVPDAEVPKDPEENMKAWIARKDRRNPQIRDRLAGILPRLFMERYGEDAEHKVKEFLMDLKAKKD